MAAETRAPERPELWVVAAWALLALEIALAIYLGLKLGGLGPVRAYAFGPALIVLAALLLGVLGCAISFVHRPFARPQRLVAFCVLGFVIVSASFPLPFPAHRSNRPSLAQLELPVQGEWTVAWGGVGETNFLLRTRPDRCSGFVLIRERDASTRAVPADPKSAFAFGEAVFAPCDGTVVDLVERWPDDGASAPDDLGNRIVLEIAPGEFLFLSGLAQDSLDVKLGERVTRGQALARVGFSANSRLTPEPHLSIHVQDTPNALAGQGIPFEFHDYFAGERRVERGRPNGAGFFIGYPVSGERVRSAAR